MPSSSRQGARSRSLSILWIRIPKVIATVVMLLQSPSWALSQTPAAKHSCDSLAIPTHGSCSCRAHHGFCIPSLQTLLLDPLSRAGDRFEASWLSHRSIHCDAIGRPMGSSKIQCDAWTEPASYLLDDRETASVPEDQPAKFESQGFEGALNPHIGLDDRLAKELSKPVLLGSNKSSSERTQRTENLLELIESTDSVKTLEKALEGKAEQATQEAKDIQLASGLQSSNGVRLTAISEIRGYQAGELSQSNRIKDKYLQRKRVGNTK